MNSMGNSGRADDASQILADMGKERAMLVCIVLAGRGKKNEERSEESYSIGGNARIYNNLDEMFCVWSQSHPLLCGLSLGTCSSYC